MGGHCPVQAGLRVSSLCQKAYPHFVEGKSRYGCLRSADRARPIQIHPARNPQERFLKNSAVTLSIAKKSALYRGGPRCCVQAPSGVFFARERIMRARQSLPLEI